MTSPAKAGVVVYRITFHEFARTYQHLSGMPQHLQAAALPYGAAYGCPRPVRASSGRFHSARSGELRNSFASPWHERVWTLERLLALLLRSERNLERPATFSAESPVFAHPACRPFGHPEIHGGNCSRRLRDPAHAEIHCRWKAVNQSGRHDLRCRSHTYWRAGQLRSEKNPAFRERKSWIPSLQPAGADSRVRAVQLHHQHRLRNASLPASRSIPNLRLEVPPPLQRLPGALESRNRLGRFLCRIFSV